MKRLRVVGAVSVYGDVFFALNFAVDLILLYVAGLLAGTRARPWRLAAGAAAGAAYALGFLYPLPSALYAPPARLAFPALSLALAYLPVPVAGFLRLAFWLYASSALAAGAGLGLAALGARPLGPAWSVPVPAWALAAAVAGLLLAVPRLVEAARRRLSLERLLLPVEVGIGSQRVTLTGLVDTGNRLRDPLTRSPVLVVELAALRGILPPEVTEAYAREGGCAVLETASRLARLPGWATRLRLLPFSTLGKRHGMLLGFRPDWVAVWHGRERVETRNATIAVCRERLAEEAAYQALVHPALVSHGSAA